MMQNNNFMKDRLGIGEFLSVKSEAKSKICHEEAILISHLVLIRMLERRLFHSPDSKLAL